MTKANVFPKKMLDSPEKAICLYLLKKETKKKIEKEAGRRRVAGCRRAETVFSKKWD